MPWSLNNTQLSRLMESLSETYAQVQPAERFPLVNSQGRVIDATAERSKAHDAVLAAYSEDLLKTFGWKSGVVIIYDPLARQLQPVFFGQKSCEKRQQERDGYIKHLQERGEDNGYEIFERDVWEDKIHPGIGILPALLVQRYKRRKREETTWLKTQGLSFYELDLAGNDSIVTKHGRKFFQGGGVITPCIFNETLLGFSIIEHLKSDADFKVTCESNEFVVNGILAPFLYTELINRLRDLEAYFIGFRKETGRIGMLPILNKRALYNRLALYMKKVDDKCISCVSVSFLDIDDFGVCNETITHQGTDKLLLEFAEILVRMWPETLGVEIARFGGDEFVVIAPGMKAQNMAPHMNDLRMRFQDLLETRWKNLIRELDTRGVTLGISIGITEYPADFQNAYVLLSPAQKENTRREYQLIDIANEHTQKIVKRHGKNAYLLTGLRVEFEPVERRYQDIRSRYFNRCTSDQV